MNREEAKELLPIIQAFAEGKTIETYLEYDNKWEGCSNPAFNPENKYRIKTEPKCRPFKDAYECWNEMLKHQPFGWIKDNVGYELISSLCDIEDEEGGVVIYAQQKNWSCGFLFNTFTFADGSAFGIKEGGEE